MYFLYLWGGALVFILVFCGLVFCFFHIWVCVGVVFCVWWGGVVLIVLCFFLFSWLGFIKKLSYKIGMWIFIKINFNVV